MDEGWSDDVDGVGAGSLVWTAAAAVAYCRRRIVRWQDVHTDAEDELSWKFTLVAELAIVSLRHTQ